MQGDVIRLIDDNNDVVANYTYDAWGKLISITDAGGSAITASNHIAIRNPIRYRGYFYDEDTKLYYCNSRYYDPQTRRFINADDEDVIHMGPGEFTDKNLFAYCDNNPVMRYDNGGEWWQELKEAGKAAFKAAVTATVFIGTIVGAAALTIGTGGAGGPAAAAICVSVAEAASTALVVSGGVAVVGATAVGVAEIGENISYSKNANRYNKSSSKNYKTPRGNQRQNKQFDDATRGLDKEAKRKIHDKISKKGLGYKDIRNMAKQYKK